jgi:hypothetical protein
MRPKLRERFVEEGRMNPEGQMRLKDSVKLYGMCTDMCPEYERVRRIVEEDVKPPECVGSLSAVFTVATDTRADARDPAQCAEAAHPGRDTHG